MSQLPPPPPHTHTHTQLFHTRYTLHKRAYHHPVSDAIDIMVAEAMVLADPYVFIPGTYTSSMYSITTSVSASILFQ